jgi:phosphoesterase RecJ-like protein
MHGNEDVVIFNKSTEEAAKLISEAEIIIFTDFNCLSRINNMKELVEKSKAVKILIDHHPDPEPFADYIISDIKVSSATEMVYRFICRNGDKSLIDKPIAECLFSGIITDTGTFSYNSSEPETYNIVSELLKLGIDKDRIHNSIYNNYSSHRMRLLGYCLNEKMVMIPEFATAYICLTQEDLKRYNYLPGDTEGFVNYPLSVSNMVFSALFIERKDHIKISFRSKNNFQVNKFAAAHFNGGGHSNAAGGEYYSTLEETIRVFIDLLGQYKEWLQ